MSNNNCLTFVKSHDPHWSGYEHSIAREQFSRYGVCFIDDFGRPIEDEEGVACLAENSLEKGGSDDERAA